MRGQFAEKWWRRSRHCIFREITANFPIFSEIQKYVQGIEIPHFQVNLEIADNSKLSIFSNSIFRESEIPIPIFSESLSYAQEI